jgi:alanine racemase
MNGCIGKHDAYSSYDAWITLDFENMGLNLGKVREQVKVPVMAVIKANAYGHGLIETGRYLEQRGIDHLFVCKLQEAIQLRDAGVSCPVHNFGPLSPDDTDTLVHRGISQSVFTEDVHALNRSASKIGKPADVHIHIDAGMGRAGISDRDALPFIETVSSLKSIRIVGTSITLPQEPEFDQEVMDRFLSLCRNAEKMGISLGLKHAASSDGIMAYPSSFYLDMVRPGILLYGYYASAEAQAEDRLGLKPVLGLKSRVSAVKDLQPGDTVSYHRTYRASKREKFALISIGYSDGYPAKAAGRGFVLIKGERYPVIAKVTANHIEALLGPDTQIQPGDEVVLIGRQGKEQILAVELAKWGEVTNYQLLARLNPLLPRIIS